MISRLYAISSTSFLINTLQYLVEKVEKDSAVLRYQKSLVDYRHSLIFAVNVGTENSVENYFAAPILIPINGDKDHKRIHIVAKAGLELFIRMFQGFSIIVKICIVLVTFYESLIFIGGKAPDATRIGLKIISN